MERRVLRGGRRTEARDQRRQAEAGRKTVTEIDGERMSKSTRETV